MENAKIILENGLEVNVNGIFYIFNSKYYFMYTQSEIVDNDYVQLYVVQVCKEVQNTPNGQVDTGNMLGMEISDHDEWSKVQTSITKIVDDKKNGTTNSEIQYLAMTMLSNLKIVSKNKFKLMKHLVEENFKVQLVTPSTTQITPNSNQPTQSTTEITPEPIQPISITTDSTNNGVSSEENVIIDYRTKFFEEQERIKELEAEIKTLQGKLDSIKGILE